MIENLYSVFDSKTGVFCRPFIHLNDQSALRDFAHAASDPEVNIGKYPEDFSLFRVATFCFRTGAIVPEPTPVSLGVAISLIKPVEV